MSDKGRRIIGERGFDIMHWRQLWLACLLLQALAPPALAAEESVTVVMVDNKFEPDHVVFHSRQPTDLTLENRGKDMHEFTAPEFLKASTIEDKKLLSNGGTDIVVHPGQTVHIHLTPGPAGDFKLICADHDWDGMVGSISVSR